jgi:hypothetical protein
LVERERVRYSLLSVMIFAAGRGISDKYNNRSADTQL